MFLVKYIMFKTIKHVETCVTENLYNDGNNCNRGVILSVEKMDCGLFTTSAFPLITGNF